MGSGRWDPAVHTSHTATKRATGTPDFAYSHTTKSAPVDTWKVHPDLDPHGVDMRESRDSDEHPTSLAIAVLFDVTGSMGRIPMALQKKLPELFGLILRKGYVEHPQVMFGAIGDAWSDRVPLQVGQFESDNKLDENLENIFLEGNGGGQTMESYELALYFMARHTSIDCWEKRGHKGYLFIIGDEMPYLRVEPKQVDKVIGDTIGEPIALPAIMNEVQQKYEVFMIRPEEGMYIQGTTAGDEIIERWRSLLGQNVLDLSDHEAVCETIALTVGLSEGALDSIDQGLDDLNEVGAGSVAGTVGKTLAKMSAGGGAVATSETPDDLGDDASVERLD